MSRFRCMEFLPIPGVEWSRLLRVQGEWARGASSTTGIAMEGSMNPLDSITGTIVSGVILALLLAALF